MLFVLTITGFEKEMSCLIRFLSMNADVLKLRSGCFSTKILLQRNFSQKASIVSKA